MLPNDHEQEGPDAEAIAEEEATQAHQNDDLPNGGENESAESIDAENLDEALSLEQQLTEALDEIAALQSEIDGHKDRALRAIAEAENARRIAQQDREKTAKYASEPLAKDLLEVSENLMRALSSVPDGALDDNDDLKQLHNGVGMVQSELHKAFNKHGIEIIDPVGGDFDPNLHQAVGEVESADVEPGKVAVCFARGYVLRDRLLRAAMVQLAKAA